MRGSFSHPSINTNFTTTLFITSLSPYSAHCNPTRSTTDPHYFHPTFPRLSPNPTCHLSDILFHPTLPSILLTLLSPNTAPFLSFASLQPTTSTLNLFVPFVHALSRHSSNSHTLSLTIRNPSSPLYPHSLSPTITLSPLSLSNYNYPHSLSFSFLTLTLLLYPISFSPHSLYSFSLFLSPLLPPPPLSLSPLSFIFFFRKIVAFVIRITPTPTPPNLIIDDTINIK